MKFRRNHLNGIKSPGGPDQGGFSLVELVFAMLFMTIVVLGVVNLQTSNLSMMSGQKNQIQAHFLANQGLEIVKALGYSEIAGCFGGCDLKINFDKATTDNEYTLVPKPVDENGQGIPVGNLTFYRRLRLSVDGNLPDAYKVRSIVEWEDSTGLHYEKDPTTAEILNSQVESSLIIF
jgi:hypothetical protein